MKKIILICAAGMSTSMLVKKMAEAAKEMEYDVAISAHPAANVKEVAGDADLVLLGPQVKFQLAKITAEVACPVEAIDMAAYGMMDGKKVIMRAKEIIGE